jgi:hypothetical protein
MTLTLSNRTIGPWTRVRRICVTSLALSFMSLLTACGGSSSTTTPTLSSISVTPATLSVAVGVTDQFAATAVYSDGSKQDVTSSVTWSSSNSQVATINKAGLASSLSAGATTLSASLSGVSGTATLTVTDGALVSIGVTPAMPSLAAGSTQQFTAIGVYTDNSTHDLTTMVTWASSDTAVASISNSAGSNGLATTLVPGSTSVSAALNGLSSPAVTLTVTTATLVSIAVTPAVASIAAGTTQQFTATGTYSDHSTQDLTSAVIWNISNTLIAPISNSSGSKGLASGSTPGQVSVSAQLGNLSSPAVTLTVTAASLVSIAVTPAASSTAAGNSQQFTATGSYSDQSTQNLTSAVTWNSSNTAVASISNAAGSSGLATTLVSGTTAVTATLNGVSSAPVTLTVTPATLESIVVTPATASLAAGTTVSFTAIGTYTDHSTQDLTTSATWGSSNAAIATISNASGSNGVTTGLQTGQVLITARVGSVTSAPATLTVTAAALVSIGVTPGAPSVVAGITQQFTATGVYTNSSTQDLTTSVTWNSSNTAVASISSASGSNGLATTLTAGSTAVSATLNGITSPAVTLTVTPAMLVSIALSPLSVQLAPNASQQLTVTGTYNNGLTQPLPAAGELFTSSNTAVATVNAAGVVAGVAGASLGATSTIGVTDEATGISALPGATTTVTASTPSPNSVAAATATALDNALCNDPGNPTNAIAPFYWEIGDQNGPLASGSVGTVNGQPILATTEYSIASASKLLYAAYVAQLRGGASNLTASDITFLNLTSGYANMPETTTGSAVCPPADNPDTVSTCLTLSSASSQFSSEPFGYQIAADVGNFYYNAGHMEVHANQSAGLGSIPVEPLGSPVQSLRTVIGAELGAAAPFNYSEPLMSGGISTTGAVYAGVLRSMLNKSLAMHDALGSSSVCTQPSSCATALYTPFPQEAWSYSLGHWVENNPQTHGDGAFSSVGEFGFYPWIDSTKTYYGIISHDQSSAAYATVQCGRLIRAAFMTGVKQTGSLPSN